MTENRQNRYWTIIVIFLFVVIITTVSIVWSKYRPTKPVEIILAQEQASSGNIYIDGAVTNPGIYPFSSGDTIGTLIQSAGGVTAGGSADSLQLIIPQTGVQETVQKIDINHAEAWLLEALPGIGPTKANAIIAYRQENGLFQNIDELTKVDGITLTLLEEIKPLITIAD